MELNVSFNFDLKKEELIFGEQTKMINLKMEYVYDRPVNAEVLLFLRNETPIETFLKDDIKSIIIKNEQVVKEYLEKMSKRISQQEKSYIVIELDNEIIRVSIIMKCNSNYDSLFQEIGESLIYNH